MGGGIESVIRPRFPGDRMGRAPDDPEEAGQWPEESSQEETGSRASLEEIPVPREPGCYARPGTKFVLAGGGRGKMPDDRYVPIRRIEAGPNSRRIFAGRQPGNRRTSYLAPWGVLEPVTATSLRDGHPFEMKPGIPFGMPDSQKNVLRIKPKK